MDELENLRLATYRNNRNEYGKGDGVKKLEGEDSRKKRTRVLNIFNIYTVKNICAKWNREV